MSAALMNQKTETQCFGFFSSVVIEKGAFRPFSFNHLGIGREGIDRPAPMQGIGGRIDA